MTTPASHEPAGFAGPLNELFETFLDDHRRALHDSLHDVTDEESRTHLVPSKTTLLGLLKHATFVELVWFNEAITGKSRAEIGCPSGPDESFNLDALDTISSVQSRYREACASSRAAAANLSIDDLVYGNHRGPLPMRWIYLHMLRELAQHCGHADILREQIIAGRSAKRPQEI
ncbi:DinB family protein [Arthrobacter monumenti]